MIDEKFDGIKTLVLTGAGASVPFGIPAMAHFLDGFPVGTPSILQIAASRSQSLHQAIDIEEVMFFLLSIQKMQENDLIAFPFLADVRQHINVTTFEQAKKEATEAANRLKEHIHIKCSSFHPEKVWEVYEQLFQYCNLRNSGRVLVFTTNYDATLEDLFLPDGQRKEDVLPNFIDGFRRTEGAGFDTWAPHEFDQNLRDGTKGLYLFKLHGSLGWRRHHRRQDIIMKAVVEERSEFSVMIYPTKVKEPESPFDELYTKFSQLLQQATELIIVGCSLRDASLRDKIQAAQQKNHNLKIRLCDPNVETISSSLDQEDCNIKLSEYKVSFGSDDFTKLIVSKFTKSAKAKIEL